MRVDLTASNMYIVVEVILMDKAYLKVLLDMLKETPATKAEAIRQLKQIGVLNCKGELVKVAR